MPVDTCETVRVQAEVHPDNPHGYAVINKTDFDPKKHTLYKEPPPKVNFSTLSNAKLREALEEAKIEIPEGADRGALIALCNEHLK